MVWQHLRYALRLWRAYPVLTSAAVLSLALGMGANTAVFSVLRDVLLSSAPVDDPERLAVVYSATRANPEPHGISFANFDDLHRTGVADLAAFAMIGVGLTKGIGQPEQLTAELVSGNFFELLGVRAAIGRTFTGKESAAPGAAPFVVISDGLWKRRFGQRAGVVGEAIEINTQPFTIVGVAPASFHSLDVLRVVDLWIPASMHRAALNGLQSFYFGQRDAGMFDVVTRLPSGVTVTQAEALLAGHASALAAAYPKENAGLAFSVQPLSRARLAPAQRAVWLRAGTVSIVVAALVLLIACANVANLLLARAAARRREVSLRLALGASQQQVAMQALVESLLLAAVGGAVGLAIAKGMTELLVLMRPPFLPAGFVPRADGAVWLFAGGVTILTTLVCGVGPALRAGQEHAAAGFGAGGRSVAGELGGATFSRAFLTAQFALTTVALVLAMLFLRSVQMAQAIQPGFDTDRLAVVSFDLGLLRYDNKQGPAFVRRVNERLATIPGVVASAVSSHVVLDGRGIDARVRLAGRAVDEAIGVHLQAIGRDYFRALGLRIVDGRPFRETDSVEGKYGWAIVNEAFAREMWPGRSPLGAQFEFVGIAEPYIVVGVAADSQYETLGEKPQPYIYIYYDQAPGLKKLALFVRTRNSPEPLLPLLEREVQAVEPRLPLVDMRTMDEVLQQALRGPRAGAFVLAAFAATALLLASIGTYGVTAFFVTQRWRELGIRVALGAQPAEILLTIARATLAPCVIGLVLGLIVASVGTRFVAVLLVGVESSDARSFGAAAAALLLAAVLAAVRPAMAALRVDSAELLQRE